MHAGGPPKSLPQAGQASTTTAARPIATTISAGQPAPAGAHEVVGQRDAQHERPAVANSAKVTLPMP